MTPGPGIGANREKRSIEKRMAHTGCFRLSTLVCIGALSLSKPCLGQVPVVGTAQRCRQMLEQASQDKNPDVRKDAVEALSLAGTNDALFQSLTSMIDDRDVPVRIALMRTLGDLKSRSAVPLLKKGLDDPVPEVALAAARALYGLHDPEGTRFLLAVVAGESKAASSYVSVQERSALRLLHTPTKLFTLAAINAVGLVPLPGLGLAVSSAQGILSQPDSSARAAALLLIGNDRNPALAVTVKGSLSDKEWSVRAAAVHVVATHPFPVLSRDLTGMLEDKKSAVRLRAAAAYIRLSRRAEAVRQRPSPAAQPSH